VEKFHRLVTQVGEKGGPAVDLAGILIFGHRRCQFQNLSRPVRQPAAVQSNVAARTEFPQFSKESKQTGIPVCKILRINGNLMDMTG
jgi:hypothetical protein